jgi:hypothetical protein
MSIRWTDKQLKEVGIPKRKLTSLVKKFEKCTQLMEELGLVVYASDGSGYLIHQSRPEHNGNGNADFGAIVADIGQGYDGGGW